MSNIGSLQELLSLYDYHYYNKDESIISDEEYDSIKKLYLTSSNKDNYDKVSGYVTTEERVKHDHPILSLQDFQSDDPDSIREAVSRLQYPIMVQPKYDGLTLVIANGKVSTRGDGEYGEDVTESTIKGIRGIEKILNSDFQVRGEALILKDDFIELNKNREKEGLELYKNSRNTASGMIRRKHSEPEKIKLFIYDILNTGLCITEKLTILSSFASEDIFVTASMEINNDHELDEFLNSLNEDDIDNFRFDVDGLVVKSNARNSLKTFGYTNHHPKDSFAIKFPVDGVWTKILGITHQVGRTGKIVPVAELEPVEILDTIVSRATLNNETYIKALNLSLLKEGTKVKVIKANEIIPAIIDIDVNENGKIIGSGVITRCPLCNSVLEYKNELQYCTHSSCPAKSRLLLEHMAKREALDIKGLSKQTVNKMFDSGLVSKATDIFNISKEDIMKLEGFGNKSSENLYNSIQEKMTEGVKLRNFITSLGIENVGKGIARDISNHFNNVEDFLYDINNNMEVIRNIHGVGEVVIESINNNRDIIEEMNKYVKVLENNVSNNDSVLGKVCISGKFDKTKKEITKLLTNKGYEVIDSVTKECDILISNGTTSSKYKKAKSMGIKIVEHYSEIL